ncbi:hypothetical protein M2R47_02060 [Moraxella sp. Tifton1]|uniref:hypothetical protein n=1 Tax=Moraxella oculi TaxID=2940516 RepID=UPI0020125E6A|nr:hypothetical protein [Moraxella sp. Tifton1]MCL1623039.1 hypothetical protein [Moraxella sp. Tifton1]
MSILALSATVAIAPAFAETTVYQTITSTTPSVELSTQPTQTTDLSFAFEDIQNLQTVVMTDSQMQETEGAWAANAFGGIMGGIGGHYGYVASYVASGTYNKRAHLAAVGTGAAMGAINPIRGASTMLNGMRATAMGTVSGAINGYASATGKNINIR